MYKVIKVYDLIYGGKIFWDLVCNIISFRMGIELYW